MEKDYPYGICGVYCGQCASGNHRIRIIASELKRLVDLYRFEWLEQVPQGFSFKEFRKGLEWFAASNCTGCKAGGGPPTCEARKCAKEKGLQSCLLCSDFLTCPKTKYHRETYPQTVEGYKRVKEVGFEKWLEEQEMKAMAGFDLCDHLQEKCLKTVNPEQTSKEL